MPSVENGCSLEEVSLLRNVQSDAFVTLRDVGFAVAMDNGEQVAATPYVVAFSGSEVTR